MAMARGLLSLANAASPPARASLRDDPGSAASETRADENEVEHVHNPGHFRVDGALFPLGVLAECARPRSTLFAFLADRELAGPADKSNRMPTRPSPTHSRKG